MVVEAPVRKPETTDRVQQVRERFRMASDDAAQAKGCAKGDSGNEWWRQPLPPSPRDITSKEPLRVLVAGGGVAGLVAAAACHAKGMKVAIFEQASQYAPYGGPIQIQSNALRALQRINPVLFEEIVAAGTVTADRVSGLKIGYKKGGAFPGMNFSCFFCFPPLTFYDLGAVFLGLGKQYEKGDWLVRFDTLQPALQAGLPPTGTYDSWTMTS
jgi:zeaxanthin epoxidase